MTDSRSSHPHNLKSFDSSKGYNCKCKSKNANPGPGIVSIDPAVHEIGCHIRINSIRNGRNTRITPDQWHDGYSLGVVLQ
jgi:hypothetical protein